MRRIKFPSQIQDWMTLPLTELHEVTLTCTLRRGKTSVPTFAVAHMGEHLISRELLMKPGVTGLSGTLSRGRVLIQFAAPRGDLKHLLAPNSLDSLMQLTSVNQIVYEEERLRMAREDSVLPSSVQSSAYLPISFDEFGPMWRDTEPTVESTDRPFLGEDALLVSEAHRGVTRSVHRNSSLPSEEFSDAYSSLCSRLGRTPEFFMEGGPIRSYYNSASVFLAGLSAFRSPLFQALCCRENLLYSFNFFDFPWRHRFFIAFVAVPQIGLQGFQAEIRGRISATLHELSLFDLQLILREGVVSRIRDFKSVMLSPTERRRFAYLAKMNAFDSSSSSVVRSVAECHVRDLDICRQNLLREFRRLP